MNVMFAAFLGGWEWIIVILAVLLLFGAKKIPELAKGLGTGIKEFKKATREVTDEIQNATADTPPPAKPRGQRRQRHHAPTCRFRNPPFRPRPDGGTFPAWPATTKRNAPTSAEGGPVKTFLEHLEDFRWVLIKSIVALFLGMLVCLFAANYVVQIIKWPLTHAPVSYLRHEPDRRRQLRHQSRRQFSAHAGTAAAMQPRHEPFRRRHRSKPLTLGTNQVLGWRVSDDPGAIADAQRMKIELVNLSPAGGFVVAFQVAIYGGVVLASPFIFYFIASFVFPALKIRERKYVYRGLFIGVGLVPHRRGVLLFRPDAGGAGGGADVFATGSASARSNGARRITSASSANSCSAWGWASNCRW